MVRNGGHSGMEIKRGDVVICAARGDHGKPRRAVMVQSELFNGTHSSVAVCLITSYQEDAPLFRIAVPAGRTTGLESQVMDDKVIAIPRNKITRRAGVLAAGPLGGRACEGDSQEERTPASGEVRSKRPSCTGLTAVVIYFDSVRFSS